MTNITSLFLSQSYADAWDDYNRSLTKAGVAQWDYVVLTASNEHQAAGFLAQIDERQKNGFLPNVTKFVVLPDEAGKRIGSGGATLSVIRYISEQIGSNDFSGLRILVIHSGGDSKRVPQYSALGKLFSPVPHQLPNGRLSTLFDEFMIVMSSVAGRIREGMVLLSGDVLLLFNSLQIDYSGNGAAAVSFKEDVNTGKNHGVFLKGTDGNVCKFLHKQSVESLMKHGAVNENGCVNIDTGAIIFSSEMLKSIYSLIDTKASYEKIVNDKVRLSLYGDFLYPLATESTLEDFYKEKPEGELCDELLLARKELWNVLRPYRMKLLSLAPAKFIHFGTTKEILDLMCEDIHNYHHLGWSNNVGSSVFDKIAAYNSVVSKGANVGKNCYFETSYVHSSANIGDNVVLSSVDINNKSIPSDVVLHGLKQIDGKFVVRIYGINDNPKESEFCGISLKDFIKNNNLLEADIWNGENRTLWEASLYPVCDSIDEAVLAALNLYDLAHGHGDITIWRSSERKSLSSGFNDADEHAIIAWYKKMQELVQMDNILKLIGNAESAVSAKNILASSHLTNTQKEWLSDKLKVSDLGQQMRLNYYIGVALGGREGDKYISDCFKNIRDMVLDSTENKFVYDENIQIVNDSVTVNLPLRVNWGGGWSDTPPYCIECGGTAINAAILLNGEMPVEVSLEKIHEKKVIFDSRDMDVHGEFDSLAVLQHTGDPYDPFALQKAALLACGVFPKNGGSLDQILERMGGGFIMRSEVTNVPKGSGLGTSSILSAACVKAIFDFVGIKYAEDDLYQVVLSMEQIMSTGGGWQDQIGGLTNGIKYITSKPGQFQKLKVQHIEIDEKTKEELNQRFVLIYTGQRRLARNLLRDVVGSYIGNEPEVLYALNEIQKVAALMRFELERGNIDSFAMLLDQHWQLSKMIDMGSTNTLINQIFASIDDMIDGRLVCGAGGGGFLQVILKKGVTSHDIHKRLQEVFQDNEIGVWNCTLLI